MPVTVLYPEARQQPDDLEREVFGPDLRIVKRDAAALSELSDADCAEADGLMILGFPVTGADLARFPRLRAIVRMGVGYDKLDRPAAAERNILICNVPDYGTTEVADHAIALALTLRRGILLHHELQRKNPPAPFRSFQHPLIQRLGHAEFRHHRARPDRHGGRAARQGVQFPRRVLRPVPAERRRAGARHRAGRDARRPAAPDRYAVDPCAADPGNARHARPRAAGAAAARGRSSSTTRAARSSTSTRWAKRCAAATSPGPGSTYCRSSRRSSRSPNCCAPTAPARNGWKAGS